MQSKSVIFIKRNGNDGGRKNKNGTNKNEWERTHKKERTQHDRQSGKHQKYMTKMEQIRKIKDQQKMKMKERI